MRVGFVGVGSMGRPMLTQVLQAGHEVSFFARRPAVVDEIRSLGAVAAPSIAALGSDAEIVVVCVFTDDQVREVCLAEEGLLASMGSGSILVVHSTCRPDTAPTLAARGGPRGIRVLDVPFSGGPDDAAGGSLTLLVGGDGETLGSARSVLTAYADPILHVGDLGDGQRVKLVNNALFGANVRLVLEAERLARDLGLDPARAFEAMSHCSANSYALGVARQMGSAAALYEAAGRYIRKDVEVARNVATECGTDVGLLGTVASSSTDEAGSSPGDPQPVLSSLEGLWDIEQIKQLKARYFRYLDLKQWDEFRDLFTADCKHFLPAESGTTAFQTNDEYFPMLQAFLGAGVTTHHGHMPEITLLSETDAEGIWAMFDYVQSTGPQGRISIKGYGHYIETYRKCDDGKWRISSKRNERLRLDDASWTVPEQT